MRLHLNTIDVLGDGTVAVAYLTRNDLEAIAADMRLGIAEYNLEEDQHYVDQIRKFLKENGL